MYFEFIQISSFENKKLINSFCSSAEILQNFKLLRCNNLISPGIRLKSCGVPADIGISAVSCIRLVIRRRAIHSRD
jgi:hypothetical protein